MSYQKLIIVGNLGRDPEMRYLPDGKPVTSFSVATSETWVKDGQRQEKTVWFRVNVWGNQAEPCNQYLAKGRSVLVEGTIQEPHVYQARDGEHRASLDVRAISVKFLSSKGDQSAQQAEDDMGEGVTEIVDDLEGLPF